jgi:hypothetical protein
MKAKDTPTHLLKFLHNAAYNQKFSLEFRDCIQNVIFGREIDDQATTFLVRKLRILCDTREEDIKKKDEKIRELEELTSELEIRLEKMREINNTLTDQNDTLRQQNDVLQKQARREYGPGDQLDDYLKTKRLRENSEKADELAIDDEIINHLSDGKIVLDTSTILQNLRAKKVYGETENKTRLNQRLYALEKNNKIKKVGEKAWQIVRTGRHGEQISEYEYQQRCWP